MNELNLLLVAFCCGLLSSHASRQLFPTIDRPWMMRDRESNTFCVLLQMSAYFEVSYETGSGGKTTAMARVQLPQDSSFLTGMVDEHHHCYPDAEGQLVVDLTFGTFQHMLEIAFTKSNDESYFLSKMQLLYEINDEEFPGHFLASGTLQNCSATSPEMKTPIERSFQCESQQKFYLFEADDRESRKCTMFIKDLRFEAFSYKSNSSFSAPTKCDQDKHGNHLLAIIVSTSLAFVALIAGFVVAYVRLSKPHRKTDEYYKMKRKTFF